MVKKFFVIFTSIILSILLFSFVCLLVVYQTVLRKVYVSKVVSTSGYYDEVYHGIQDSFADYAPSLHIEDEITNLDSIVTKDMVIRDIGIVINGVYEGSDIKIDTRELENHLDQLISNSLSLHHITPSNEDKKYLNEFKKNIVSLYRDKVYVYVEKYLSVISKNYRKIKKLSMMGIWGLYILFHIFLFILICLNRNLKDICREVGTIFLTCMFLSFIVRFLLYDRFQYILILSKPFSRLVVYVIRDILMKICIFSSVLGIVGFILIIIGVEREYKTLG